MKDKKRRETTKMKKLVGILLAVMMLGAFACAAMAEEDIPQPEAGKKFESDWAIPGALVQIGYEEAGYKIQVEVTKDDASGSVWEYSCYYNEDTDSLASVSSMKKDYTVDTATGDAVFGEAAYEDFDDENTVTTFTIDEHGCLIWKDGREDAGAGLEFTNIGYFNGVWTNEAEAVTVEFIWNGYTAEEFFYSVYVTIGKEGDEQYTSYIMNGDYDPAAGKLIANGTSTTFTKNADGSYDAQEAKDVEGVPFSKLENGAVLLETDHGIELDPVM
jgi:hypothetical protein